MAITFRPKQGMILMCDFDGMRAPEMIKVRKVVIISPDKYNRMGLYAVIPLSTTKPQPIVQYHYQLSQESLESYESDSPSVWAKCDMIYTFRRERLDRIKVHKNGRRHYLTGQVTKDDFKAIQSCISVHLDLIK